jgi:hypothetical protein
MCTLSPFLGLTPTLCTSSEAINAFAILTIDPNDKLHSEKAAQKELLELKSKEKLHIGQLNSGIDIWKHKSLQSTLNCIGPKQYYPIH